MADDPSRFPALARGEFDLIVVGGGITGCGVARDAALRGLRVALFEQDDFGSGTSSRSSRLIHGGVRYLEHGHLRLVFEASAERRRLLRIAPHLVHPLAFTWPVYSGARVPRWKLAAGLTLYDALAMFRNVGRHRRLSAADVRRDQPALRVNGLTGGATYFDASTDDSRLTLAVALDARDRGAAMMNHARVIAITAVNGAAAGVEVCDTLTGVTTSVTGKVIVNATGPWCDAFRRLEMPAAAPRVQGSKGVHIAVPQVRVGNRGALTLLSPIDGRVMFVLPNGALTIIGTTDTFSDLAPDDVRANESDVAYLLSAANAFFPGAQLHRTDVVAAWAGIRPLAATGANNSVAVSREHTIEITPAGVVTITGGKLTTFRVMAAQTVDAALRRLGRTAAPAADDAPIQWDHDLDIDVVAADASRETGDAVLGKHLVGRYGRAWPAAWRTLSADAAGMTRVETDAPHRLGEMRYACEAEMAHTLADLLIRRTRIAFETRDHGRSVAPRVAEYVAPLLGWSPSVVADEIARYDRDVDRLFTIEPD